MHSVVVFCGSRPGVRPEYTALAHAVGTAIAAKGWRLIFGAGDQGMMGTVAEAVRNAGGQTLGVIPTHLLDRERPDSGGEAPIITETMHERKKVMVMNADAIMVLPGGPGSLDEFFEVLTWAQLGLHAKPIILLGAAGYWDRLTGLVDFVIKEGFADPSLNALFHHAQSLEEALTLAAPQGAPT